MHGLANPARFLRWSGRIQSPLMLLALALLAFGLYRGLFASPPDYQQGDSVRIIYVHVPAAWMATFVYAFMAVASAVALVWRHPLADVTTRAAAPLGACFTALCLITGSLWGKPMWGAWWVWDARLTSVLVLFFLYLGYIGLVNAFDEPTRAGRAGAILVLVGAVNLPIVKFSVDWWNTLHQPASLSPFQKPAIDPAMLTPLLVMGGAFMAFFGALLLMRIKRVLLERRLAGARMAAVAMAERAAALPGRGEAGRA